jgi:hypothetical protein
MCEIACLRACRLLVILNRNRTLPLSCWTAAACSQTFVVVSQTLVVFPQSLVLHTLLVVFSHALVMDSQQMLGGVCSQTLREDALALL